MTVDNTDTTAGTTGAATSATGAHERPRGRAGHIALWVLQVLLALGFAFSAFGKLAGDPMMVQLYHDIGWGDWFRHFTGAVEIAAAIGLLIPRLAGLAALGLVGVMVGAVITHLAIGGSLAPAILFGVLAGIVAWGRRGRTAELASALISRQA